MRNLKSVYQVVSPTPRYAPDGEHVSHPVYSSAETQSVSENVHILELTSMDSEYEHVA